MAAVSNLGRLWAVFSFALLLVAFVALPPVVCFGPRPAAFVAGPAAGGLVVVPAVVAAHGLGPLAGLQLVAAPAVVAAHGLGLLAGLRLVAAPVVVAEGQLSGVGAFAAVPVVFAAAPEQFVAGA